MTQPNILILHADQLRYDGLGCSGNPFARTPNLDALAGEGSLFTRHIVSNPVCMPSRASLFTGLYPSGHNVWGNGVPLLRQEAYGPPGRQLWPMPGAGQIPTMPDLFSAAGYDTVSFGKLHLTPNRSAAEYGFGEGWPLTDSGGLSDWHGPYFGFRHVEMTRGHALEPCLSGHYADWLQARHPDVRARALAPKPESAYPLPNRRDLYASPLPADLHHSMWLADRFSAYLAGRAATDPPFFAFVGFPDPHHSFSPSEDLVALFKDAPVREPVDPEGLAWQDSPVRELLEKRHDIGNLSAEERRVIIRYTYAMVHNIDRAAGRILTALKANGAWDNTIVVFTADHGDFLCDHRLLYKALVGSDNLLRVPFILRAPGAALPARIGTPMSNCDVLPTLAALAGLAVPEGLHGRDIAPVIRTGEEHAALAECWTGEPGRNNLTLYDDRYRLTLWPESGHVELFDHQADPGETRNVAGRPGHRRRQKALLRQLDDRLRRQANPRLARLGEW